MDIQVHAVLLVKHRGLGYRNTGNCVVTKSPNPLITFQFVCASLKELVIFLCLNVLFPYLEGL